MLLIELGYQVISVKNGKEALEVWRKGKVDLVLLDIWMPVMNGIETLAAIRQYEYSTGCEPTPVIALTAEALKETEQLLLKAGFDGYLGMPVKVSQLASEIRHCMNRQSNEVLLDT